MSLLDKIRSLIGAFYDGEINADQFREQFGPLLEETDGSDLDTEARAIQAEGLFADYIEGILTEQTLKEKLFALAPSVRLHVKILADVSPDDPVYRYFQYGPSGNAMTSPPTQSQVSGSDSPIAIPHLVPCLT
jgi:hypothetical protein